MDYRLVFTKRALSDLNQVIGRIADVDHDIDVAFHFGSALLDHVDLLTRFPRMAPVIRTRSRIRKLVHSPIVVYYRVHDVKQLVEILHFRHGARKPPSFS